MVNFFCLIAQVWNSSLDVRKKSFGSRFTLFFNICSCAPKELGDAAQRSCCGYFFRIVSNASAKDSEIRYSVLNPFFLRSSLKCRALEIRKYCFSRCNVVLESVRFCSTRRTMSSFLFAFFSTPWLELS